MRKYEITFDGETITAEGKEGCSGKQCVSDTEKLLEVLRPQLKSRRLKPEYNRSKVAERAI